MLSHTCMTDGYLVSHHPLIEESPWKRRMGQCTSSLSRTKIKRNRIRQSHKNHLKKNVSIGLSWNNGLYFNTIGIYLLMSDIAIYLDCRLVHSVMGANHGIFYLDCLCLLSQVIRRYCTEISQIKVLCSVECQGHRLKVKV